MALLDISLLDKKFNRKDRTLATHLPMQTIGDKIRLLRRHLGFSGAAFVASVGLLGKRSRVGTWETYGVLNYRPVLDLICKHRPQFNRSWLETGDGDMLL